VAGLFDRRIPGATEGRMHENISLTPFTCVECAQTLILDFEDVPDADEDAPTKPEKSAAATKV
jgi:hypothetical protein